MSAALAEIIAVLDAAYPPALAHSWDSVGLVCGDPADTVDCVTVAVDPTAEVVATVPERGLLLAHHPLLLRGVDTVAASTPKGALIHQLIRRGAALFTAHTNADAATPGVSDALADALGLTVESVLEPAAEGPDIGIGRIGRLAEPVRFADFVARADALLPRTTWGVRGSGDPDALVSRIAVCGGAGDSLLGAASAAGVDVYLTADLRHHPADEHRRTGGPALVDVAHWASEFPWCGQAAALLSAHFGAALPVTVCDIRTDPWNIEYSSSKGSL